jgi:hypothetical protein
VVGGPPDFVGLGAQKAGTTWWFRMIVEHPGAAPCSQGYKELDFFARYWNQSFTECERAAYHRHFPRTAGVVRGEWTPEYLLDPWSLACLWYSAPEARLLVMLRDPVERFRSSLTHIAAGIRKPNVRDARIAFQRGCYAELLLVLQYERCRDDPRPELARTYAHLGLDDHPVPVARLNRRFNATEIPKVELGAEALDRLRHAYRPQVAALSKMFPDLDLDLWPNFRD